MSTRVCRFLVCLQTLISCGLSGPTSALAFVEAVLAAISRSASSLLMEQQWRLWTTLVSLLTDAITQVGGLQLFLLVPHIQKLFLFCFKMGLR